MSSRYLHVANSVVAVSTLIAAAALTSACGGSGSSHSGGADKAGPTVSGAALGASGPVGVKISDSSLGPILTDQDGRTLYAFVNDKNGSSSCTGTCIATWPALISTAPAAAGTGIQSALLTQTARADGTSQASYNNWPLYYYVGDAAPGEVDGEGLSDVWFAVGADGKLVKQAAQ